MQRLFHATYFILIVCGGVMNNVWPFFGGAVVRAGSLMATQGSLEHLNKKKQSDITYSWFLESHNKDELGKSDNNDSKLIGNPIVYKAEDESYKLSLDLPNDQEKYIDFLYLNQAGIWVKFHEYASNVDISAKFTDERNVSLNSKTEDNKLLEDQTKENQNNTSSYEDIGFRLLRRNKGKDGIIYSFFQVISQDWLLGWNFICDYFKEFILK